YSDGITDAINSADEFFAQRFVSSLERARDMPLSQSIYSLISEVRGWCDASMPDDDISVLAFEIRDSTVNKAVLVKKFISVLVLLAATRVEVRAQSAATFHVFPQLADGASPDGSFFASTILTTNINTEAVSCALRLYGGLSNRFLGSASFSLASQGSFSLQVTMAAVGFLQPLAIGYGTMTCDRPVTA